MSGYSLSHVGDRDVIRIVAEALARNRTSTATLLAGIAEIDARKLYLPAGYPSTYAYCVHELHLSEQSALKRLRAARAAWMRL